MAKKYVPSGYQIINIDIAGKTSGTAFDPVTEDEKILYDLLVKSEEISTLPNKPILLRVPNVLLMGFVAFFSGRLAYTVGVSGSQFHFEIYRSGTQLIFDYHED